MSAAHIGCVTRSRTIMQPMLRLLTWLSTHAMAQIVFASKAITTIDLTQHIEAIMKQWQAQTKQACVNTLPTSNIKHSLIDAYLIWCRQSDRRPRRHQAAHRLCS